MRSPGRHRPLRREYASDVEQPRLAFAAEHAVYVGSSEHKTRPSFAGQPKLRSDATPCPPELKDQWVLTEWLRVAIDEGQVGDFWENEFPRYVWLEREGQWFEGRLCNQVLGEYKGYPIDAAQAPRPRR